MKELENGVHKDIPFNEYAADDGINASTLKHCARSPLHAHAERNHPSKQTPAMALGDAAHASVLEPERFEADFAKGLTCQRRSKADKEKWAEWEAAHPTQTALGEKDWNIVASIRDSVSKHPAASELLLGEGLNEVTLIWDDEDTGHRCKGRIDRLTSYGSYPAVVDLKTTKDASGQGFGTEIARYHYHASAAWYLRGANALAPMNRRFFFIAVEKVPPFAVGVHELDAYSIEVGSVLCQRWLEKYTRSLDSGNWEGYPAGIINQTLPVWAQREIDEEETY